jgi:hypothetical protein
VFPTLSIVLPAVPAPVFPSVAARDVNVKKTCWSDPCSCCCQILSCFAGHPPPSPSGDVRTDKPSSGALVTLSNNESFLYERSSSADAVNSTALLSLPYPPTVNVPVPRKPHQIHGTSQTLSPSHVSPVAVSGEGELVHED